MKTKMIIFGLAVFVFVLMGFKLLTHNHEYGNWVISITPTEETEGEQFRKCKTCGKIEEKQLPKLVHVHDNDSEIIKEPTCISTGILKAVCKKCGVVQELEINIDKAGHKYGEWEEISEKMNETTGTKKRVCTLCSYVDEQVHNHEFNEWKTIVQDTCLQTGKIESTCEQCSYKTTEVTPISDHKFSEWDVYKIPTCLADGNAKRSCIYCNLVEDVVLPQSDDAHVYGEWKVIVKETLTTTGLRERTCTLCNYVDPEVIPVHQHQMTEWEVTVPSTCSKGGKAQRHCLSCDFKEETDLMPDSSLHKYELDWTSKPGYVLDKCTVCGHIQAEYVDKPNKE